MKLLIKCEIQKLLRQKYFLIGGLILLAFTFFLFFSYAMNSPATYPVDTEHGRIEGREAVLYNKAVYAQYAGVLTSDKVNGILKDYQCTRDEYEKVHSDYYDCPVVFDDMISLSGLSYEAGYEDMAEFIESHSYSLNFGFPYLWSSIFSIFHDSGIVFALVLMIVLAPLFANEYSSGADGIILTTKYGRSKLIGAKFVVANLFATLAVIGFSAFVLIICSVYYGGFSGWQVDIQMLVQSAIYIDLPIKMNCLQFYFFNVVIFWIAGIGIAALACCCSAFSKNTFLAFVVSDVLFFIPMLLQQVGFGGVIWSKYLFVFPACAMKPQFVIDTLADSAMGLLPTLFEMPILVFVFNIVSSILLFMIARRQFQRHQVV